jgi:hypothetical protein
MGEDAALHRRRPVGAGTLWFTGACLMLSLCLVVLNGVGSGVGASSVPPARSASLTVHRTAAHPGGTATSDVPPRHARLGGTDDVPPPRKPPTPALTPATPPSPAVPPVAVPVSMPAVPAAPPPPPPATSPSLPARGEASAYGCGPALAYLAAYAAPGFTFECPGPALGHQAMTCISEPGICDNERLISIADPCAAAYMNEASNSWVLTGASSAPIDPYGACG